MANPVQINDGTWVDVVSGVGKTTAQEARTALAALVAHDGAGPRLGVFYEGNQQLLAPTSTTSPSMQVSVSPLAFCGQKAAAEGVYIGRSVGTVLVDIAAAPASNSRIDTVYVMQRDLNSTTSPDGVTQGEIGVVTGTAGVSPTAPAVPAGAVVIGTVQVAAGVTATSNAGCTIITTCPYTVAAGAPIPTRSQDGRDALTPYDGLRVYRFDVHRIETYTGSGWTYQSRIVSGAFSGTTDVNGYATITHGAPFTPTAVTGTLNEGVQWQIDNITSTTFRLRVLTSTGAVNASHAFLLYALVAE